MTDKERQEFDTLKENVRDLSMKVSNLESANNVLNTRILNALKSARERNLIPAAWIG